jgi:hypothetical protein
MTSTNVKSLDRVSRLIVITIEVWTTSRSQPWNVRDRWFDPIEELAHAHGEEGQRQPSGCGRLQEARALPRQRTRTLRLALLELDASRRALCEALEEQRGSRTALAEAPLRLPGLVGFEVPARVEELRPLPQRGVERAQG